MTIRRIAVLKILLLLLLTISCSRANNQKSNQSTIETGWWYPIIQKHKIDLSKFSYKATFTCIDSNNHFISKWIEMGNDDGSDEKYLKLKNAIIIVLFDTVNLKPKKGNYWILSSPRILYDQKKNTLDYDWGKLTWFDINDKDIIPLDTMEMWGKFDFNHSIKIAPESFKKLTP